MTVADALAHPTWKMGPKITVDSSTLMNKGLEVIEAHLLFGAGYDQIDVVVHPQSIVHSMVEMTDGATIAQLSMPDMRLPIGYALSYPGRMATAFGAIDWAALGRLEFEVPDPVAFRCLPLAYEAGRQGGTAPACLNGANEVAVDGFLNGRLRWVDIPSVIEGAMERFVASEPRDLDDVLAADAEGAAWPAEGVAQWRRAPGRCRPSLLGPAPPVADHRGRGRRADRYGPTRADGRPAAPGRGGRRRAYRGRIVRGAGHGAGRPRPAGNDRPARVGPFCRGQAGRHEGERVLRGLRPPSVVGTQGRDDLRDQGAAAGGLLPDNRHDQRGEGGPGRRAPGLSQPTDVAAPDRGLRRLVRPFRPGLLDAGGAVPGPGGHRQLRQQPAVQ